MLQVSKNDILHSVLNRDPFLVGVKTEKKVSTQSCSIWLRIKWINNNKLMIIFRIVMRWKYPDMQHKLI